MNPATILVAAGEAIEKRGPSNTRFWALVYRADKIQCVPIDCIAPNELTFGRYSTVQLTNGLTRGEWESIFSQFFNFFRQKGML